MVHPLKVIASAIDSKFGWQRSYPYLKLHHTLHLGSIFSEAGFPPLYTFTKIEFQATRKGCCRKECVNNQANCYYCHHDDK
ncbi:MAG: hypothetical protein ACUVTR_02930 [Dehalococcoidia bacterium]